MQIIDYLSAAAGDPSRAMLDILSAEAGPISEILLVLNIAVFSIGVLVLVWAGIVGLARTALSGQFLKPAAQVWLPVRLILGLSGLLPVYHGLTVAQVVVLGAATLGIGVANTAWQGAYTGLISWGGDTNFSAPPAANQNEAVWALIAAQICQYEVNREVGILEEAGGEGLGRVEMKYGKIGAAGLPGQVDFSAPAGSVALIYGGPQGYREDLCGGVMLPISSEYQHFSREKVMAAHAGAMQALASDLQPISQALAGEHRAPDPGALREAEQRYRQTVAQGLGQAAAQADGEFNTWIQDGEGRSWIYAGASLAKIASINREIQAAAELTLLAVPPVEGDPGTIGLGATVAGSQLKFAGAREAVEKTSFSIKKPDLGVLVEPIRSNLLDNVMDWLTKEGGARTGEKEDLLGGLTNLGHKLILGTMAAMGSVLLALGIASGASLGTLGGLGGAVFSIFSYIFCLPLLGAGLLFAYYLPFLPLIYWILGVMTWLIIFTEALFGAPLWALAHLLDSEAEGLGQRTSHGYLFLLQLIFRPSLMLGGLVAGWLILQFFGGFLRHSLSIFFGSGGAFSGAAGILGFVACLVMFAYLAWQVCGKAFSLIHHLPAEVLAWVGGHGGGRLGGEEKEVERKATGVVAGVRSGPGRGGGGGKPGPGGGIPSPGGGPGGGKGK